MPSVRNKKGRPGGKRAEQVYYDAESGGDVSEGVPPKHVNYTKKRGQFDAGVFLAYDSTLELFNEAGDGVFTFTEYYEEDLTLFWISVVFLSLTLLVRCAIAFKPLYNGAVKDGFRNRLLYALGVVLVIIEPVLGQALVNSTLKDTAGAAWNKAEQSGAAAQANKTKEDARSKMFIGASMVLLEDIPELALSIAHAVRMKQRGKEIDQVGLYWFTVSLTVLHLIRVGADFVFEYLNNPHIPKGVEIKGDNIDDKWANRLALCHKYIAVEMANLSNHTRKVLDIVTCWIENSGSLKHLE